jgi:hypothetical protein
MCIYLHLTAYVHIGSDLTDSPTAVLLLGDRRLTVIMDGPTLHIELASEKFEDLSMDERKALLTDVSCRRADNVFPLSLSVCTLSPSHQAQTRELAIRLSFYGTK